MVRPTLPALFTGKMDTFSVGRFVHQLDNYFRVFELNDGAKMGQIAIALLEGTTYNWFTI